VPRQVQDDDLELGKVQQAPVRAIAGPAVDEHERRGARTAAFVDKRKPVEGRNYRLTTSAVEAVGRS
jgi:hypothetical protein